MTRQDTISAAILAQRGNHDQDDSYPRPLTCYACGARETWEKWDQQGDLVAYWYVTESDPLPAGWQEIRSDTPPARMIYCSSCWEDHAEGREPEYAY